MKGKRLISVNTMEMPGKVILTYVEVTEEIVDLDGRFMNRTFELVDDRDPGMQKLKSVLCPRS